jgi:hypothetical protein
MVDEYTAAGGKKKKKKKKKRIEDEYGEGEFDNQDEDQLQQ